MLKVHSTLLMADLTEKELLWLRHPFLLHWPQQERHTDHTVLSQRNACHYSRFTLHASPPQKTTQYIPSKNCTIYTPQQQQRKGLMKSKLPVVSATLKRIPRRNGIQCCHNIKDIIIPHLLGATVTVKSWCGGRLPISGVAPCPHGWRLWPPICIWPGPPPRPPLYGMS